MFILSFISNDDSFGSKELENRKVDKGALRVIVLNLIN